MEIEELGMIIQAVGDERVAERTEALGRIFSGAKLRSLRKARGWSQAQLAMKSGLRVSRISLLENNHVADPRFSAVLTLAEALGCCADELA